ncbi:hypothetical protein CVIRNUC_010667 [Coccomyxa viridis]|uniref:Extracellular protein n=1 Tax=Coccomyxa viridis TaxID=1274662 RepID=A0AAV1IL78_9CHLO|nr:hypothetical protein CVIRNUC_010667 [Coccomyxa viridis]
MRSPVFFIVALAAGSFIAHATKDPDAFAQDLENNRASAIEANRLLGKVTPLFTGYGALNDAIPTPVLVNCHYGPSYLGPTDSSSSAAQYIQNISYIVGDGYQPVTVVQPKGTYNQSWAFGLTWTGSCLIVNQRPTCNFTFDAHSRASGTTQMTRVPTGGTVAFQSCGVWMDNNNVTSTTCFRDDSTTVVQLDTAFDEESISKIYFFTTFTDTDPGNAGTYTLQYPCQFDFNSVAIFNPAGNAAGLDPRITAVLPNADNGGFGAKGNGGNLGRRLMHA